MQSYIYILRISLALNWTNNVNSQSTIKSQLVFQLLRSWPFYSIAPLFKVINKKNAHRLLSWTLWSKIFEGKVLSSLSPKFLKTNKVSCTTSIQLTLKCSNSFLHNWIFVFSSLVILCSEKGTAFQNGARRKL